MENEHTILIFELTGCQSMAGLQIVKPGNNIQWLINDFWQTSARIRPVYQCMGSAVFPDVVKFPVSQNSAFTIGPFSTWPALDKQACKP